MSLGPVETEQHSTDLYNCQRNYPLSRAAFPTSFPTNDLALSRSRSTCSFQLKLPARRSPFSRKSDCNDGESSRRVTLLAISAEENLSKNRAAPSVISRCTARSEATIGNPHAIASTSG